MRISGLQEKLQRRLEQRVGRAVLLSLHGNRRVMVSFRWIEPEILSLRLHHMFLSAGARDVAAIARFAQSKQPSARREIERYIRRYSHLLGVALPAPDPALGDAYDLRRVFHRLNRRCFGGRVRARIEWGRRVRRERTRTIRLGYYDEANRRIVINPALDRRDVPSYVLEWIVFHEMLHVVLGFREQAGRTIAHGPEFRRRERAFSHYARASEWEAENLDRLLRL